MSEKILHLTLKKEWFDLIAEGKKKIEFREYKPYCIKRLHNKEYDLIHFRNGYRKDSPFMIVECKGINIGFSPIRNKKRYCIHLGKVLEIRNWAEIKNECNNCPIFKDGYKSTKMCYMCDIYDGDNA